MITTNSTAFSPTARAETPTASASRPAVTMENGTQAIKSPMNAVPLVGFFGTLNPTDGGHSQRYSSAG